MTPDELDDLLGAYVLDALSPEERALVEEHLHDSPVAQEEVRELTVVVDQLSLAAIPRDPPPVLRARLLAVVEQEAAEWRAAQAHPEPPAPTREAAGPTTAPPATQGMSGLRGRLLRLPAYAYGAGAALVAAAVLLAVILTNRGGVTVVHRPGTLVAQVVDGIHLTGATFTVEVRSDHTTRVSFAHLPTLPAGKAFELWLIPAKGKPVPVSGFVGNGTHAYSATYQRDAAAYAVAAVTIERAPGNALTPSPYLAMAAKLSGPTG